MNSKQWIILGLEALMVAGYFLGYVPFLFLFFPGFFWRSPRPRQQDNAVPYYDPNNPQQGYPYTPYTRENYQSQTYPTTQPIYNQNYTQANYSRPPPSDRPAYASFSSDRQFCGNCGSATQAEWQYCPNCASPLK